MNGSNTRPASKLAAIGVIAGLGITGVALPANAATSNDPAKNSKGECLATPSYWDVIKHKEVSHLDKVVTPGEDAVTHDEARWSREVPAVDAVTHEEVKFFRDIPGQDAITHEQWKYSRFVPGTAEVNHQERQFSRTNPGQTEVSHKERKYSQFVPGQKEIAHKERQFTRENPGQAEVNHKEYQFSRTNPGQQELSHQEYQYQQTQYRTRTRTPLYGEVEHKKVKGWQFVDGGSVTVNGQHVSGHWVQANAGTFYEIPDSIVNAAWGSGGIPDQYMGTGSVSLRSYGGPNVTVQYQAYKEQTSAGYTNWGPWSDWSTTNPGGSTDTRDVASQTVNYNNGNWTTDVNPAGWTKTNERKVVDQAYVAPHKEYRAQDGSATPNAGNAGWFTQPSFQGWSPEGQPKTVVDQAYIAPFAEWRAQDGSATTDAANAGWFPEETFDGWSQYGQPKKVVDQEFVADKTLYLTRDDQGNLGQSTDEADASWIPDNASVDTSAWTEIDKRKVIDQQYVAPFEEWRAQDGSATTQENNAGWFTEETFDGWSQYGPPITVIDEAETKDETFYLTRDDQGNLGESTDAADASVFESADGIDLAKWREYGRETVTDQEAVPSKRVYLTQIAQGVLGETDDIEQASWLLPEDPSVDPNVWEQAVDEEGNRLTRVVTDEEAVPGYTEYYVPDGEPTRELGESNWTTDEPEGWAFVDDREVTDKEAVPATVTFVKVIDKEAWNEKKFVPATYKACALATTGGEDMWGPAGLGILAIALGGAAVIGTSIRRRHLRLQGELENS